MHRAPAITTTTIDRWLIPHIAGVLAFADRDTAFGVILATWLDEENWSVTPTPTIIPSNYLVPDNLEQAEDIVDWLMHELATHPEARIARSLMMSWAGSYEIPADVELEADGVVSVGPTVGLIKKGTRSSDLQIVIDADWQAEQPIDKIMSATHSLSQHVIATELRKAGGKIGSLHPETAEWCMGGRDTTLHLASPTDLRTLRNKATEHQLHHEVLEAEGAIVGLAISPTIQNTFVTEIMSL